MASTIKPTGIDISRSSTTMTATWKIGQAYTKQEYKYSFNGKYPKSVGTTDTLNGYVAIANGTTHSMTVTLPEASFFPTVTKTKCTKFTVQVRGYASSTGKWSAWTSVTYKFIIPNNATISRSGVDFTPMVDEAYTAGSGDPYLCDIEYETVISSVAKQASVKWSSAGKGNVAGTYQSGSCANGATVNCAYQSGYTTWFRCRPRGISGTAKAYTYENQMYTDPLAPTKVSASMVGTNITAKWVGHNTNENPTDNFEIYYAIDTPLADLACPAGATWVKGMGGIANTAKTATFAAAQRPGTDQALWVKVRSVYGAYTTDSDVVFCQGGVMASPTVVSCVVDTDNKSAALTWTDNSSVPDSKIAVVFSDGSVLGTFAHGTTSGSVTYKGTTDVQFGVYVFQGTTATKYSMKSETVFYAGADVPLAPTSFSCTGTAEDGTVSLAWTNAWTDADGTEISYADHADAWESTDEPTRYEIEDRKVRWNVASLDVGKTWYFKLRSIGEDSDGNTAYSPYSAMVSVDLASAPEKPELFVSDNVLDVDQTLTLTWAYTTTDKSDQASAIIYDQQTGATENFIGDGSTTAFALANVPSSITEITIDGSTTTAYTHSSGVITFSSAPGEGTSIVVEYEFSGTKTEIAHIENNSLTWSAVPGWDYGSTHDLSVICTSESGYASTESDAVTVLVAPKPVVNSIEGAISAGISSGVLTALPLTLNVTGAGTGGVTSILIERIGDYHMERPDESEMDGFDGETIFTISYSGEKTISITQDDLVGSFDDGAKYRLTATVTDEVGQSGTASYDFTVAWAHQASIPTASVSLSGLTATITATAPSTYLAGDVVDIYRLSVDKPEIIIKDGSFGTAYLDPYPAASGGYRCVHRTYNGDYIAGTDQAAWVDVSTSLSFDGLIIDFGNQQVSLPYNMALSNEWEKSFTETKYLNGHIAGDWSAGTSRRASITSTIASSDTDTVELMRDLAVYEGTCHVRTSEGSSFSADVQVTEGRESATHQITYSLTITRVDPEGYDGEEA